MTVTFWAKDEHRLGLLPVVRRVRALRGHRPVARVHRRYQGLSAYSVVRPCTGQSWWTLLPTVSTEVMTVALAAFTRDEGIGPQRRTVLVRNQAGWQTATGLIALEGIHLAFLPASSPALPPAERLRPLLDESIVNRTFPDLEAREEVLAEHCWVVERERAPIKATLGFIGGLTSDIQ